MTDINAIGRIDQSSGSTSVKKTGGQQGGFSSFFNETKSLDTIFEEASKKYNVSVHLLKAIGKAESNFNPTAVSRSGAQGVMQLMPKTAKSLGVIDSFNPSENIMGGAKYIKELLDKYDGDTSLALAAYNAGMNNVKKYGGIPPFKETTNYVKKVLEYMKSDIQTGITVSGQKVTSHIDKTRAEQKNLAHMTARSNHDYTMRNSNSYEAIEDALTLNKYLEFLELFTKEEQEDEEKESNTNQLTSSITYNLPVLNLLKSVSKL